MAVRTHKARAHVSPVTGKSTNKRVSTKKRSLGQADSVVRTKKRRLSPGHGKLNIFDSSILNAKLLRRSSGPEGTKRLITAQHEKQLKALWGTLDNKGKQKLETLLARFDGQENASACGIFLRAIAARSASLPKAKNQKFFSELKAFAKTLQRMSADEILTQASVLDLDSTVNTNFTDPLIMYEKKGVIHAPDESDAQGDNDGLIQRFTASCGPTVLQMMICEADPVSAFSIHTEGLVSDCIEDSAASFQRKILEECAGVAIGRREAQLRTRVRNALGRLKANQSVNAKDLVEFNQYWAERGPRSSGASRVLKTLRERFRGFPSRAELSRLRRAGPMPQQDSGMSGDELLQAMEKYLKPLSGVTYQSTKPEHGFARGQAWRHLNTVEQALRKGIDIPFSTAEPAHWMLLTHVKGKSPHRSFLVSDPDGGRTAWVSERNFRKGSFVDKQFHLCESGERGYVDSFLLPKTSAEQ